MIFGQTMQADDAGPRAGAASVPHGTALALGLAAIWAVLSAAPLTQGALTLNRHEGDAMHLADLVLRMAQGERPHLDFMTPIGAAALAPIAGFVALGAGLGTAFLLAQAAVAAVLLPALWWAGLTRFGGGLLGLAFGAAGIALCVALVHGGPDAAVSVSMHYNRWAWAISYVLLALLILPAARPAPRLEGAILGLGFAALALTKMTYFVGLAPVALAALALRREGAHALWALLAGAGAAGVVTALAGPAFWGAYLGDLLTVASSESRAAPGLSAVEVLSAPTHLGATLVLLAAVALLRRAGQGAEGALLLAAVPGFTLITWQNYGNDPQWLPWLALALLALRPGGPRGQPHLAAALVAAALALPSLMNVATSPVRTLSGWAEDGVPLLGGLPEHDDLRIAAARTETVLSEVPAPAFADPPEPEFWGRALPDCTRVHGGMRSYAAMTAELEAAGFAGRPAFVADTMQSLWMFGDVPRLPGGAPWYYGGLPGGAAAEIMVVPLCPVAPDARGRALAALAAMGWPVTEVFRGAHAAVLEIDRR